MLSNGPSNINNNEGYVLDKIVKVLIPDWFTKSINKINKKRLAILKKHTYTHTTEILHHTVITVMETGLAQVTEIYCRTIFFFSNLHSFI